MQSSERQLEHAQQAVRAAADREVDRIRSKLVLAGDEYCQDCGDEIGAARRTAMPSATRCISCQCEHESSAR